MLSYMHASYLNLVYNYDYVQLINYVASIKIKWTGTMHAYVCEGSGSILSLVE